MNEAYKAPTLRGETAPTATSKRTVYRARVARLVNHGFQRGKHEEQNDGNCTTCERRIQTVRSWWIDGGGEFDDGWNGYCMACAEKRVTADEKLWSSYAEMGPNEFRGSRDGSVKK